MNPLTAIIALCDDMNLTNAETVKAIKEIALDGQASLRKLYEAASKGFHTSETCGPDKKYLHVSKFPTIQDLFDYEHAWTALIVSLKEKP